MNVLSHRPNLLFLIWIRNKHIMFLLNHKLNKNLYFRKLIIALTTNETGNGVDGDFIIWKVNGKTHLEPSHDGKVGPAYIYGISKKNPNGTYQSYYMNGELHRDYGPAIINGISNENLNGKYHAYYKHGKRHRDDGPAKINGISKINPNGNRYSYYRNGVRHRNDGPAIINKINPNGAYYEYLVNGELHRDDGPAIINGISKENPNGTYRGYYKHGVQVDPF